MNDAVWQNCVYTWRNRGAANLLLWEKFRHRSAVTLGQESVLTAGIVPLFDGNGVKESPPQHAEMEFFITGKSELQTIYLHDAGVTFCIDQQFFMGAVVDEEGLVGIACAEVIAQQRKYTVLGSISAPKTPL